MDIHQAGTPRIRYEYAYALQDTTAWRVLDQQYRFDWVVLPRRLPGEPDLIDFLDADRERWALVFLDDAAALWLRRDGALAALAAREGYPLLPAGLMALGPLGARANADATLRDSLRAEARRAIADSPEHGRASVLAAQVELTEGRMDSALVHAREAARLLPLEPGVQDLLGLAAYHSDDPATALAAWRREARNVEHWPERDLRFGTALAALGRREEARRAYERSLARQPALTEARDSLEALSRR
jgi:tetratricopeptide (TPR) repeat protein